MHISVGCDIGTAYTKAVIMEGNILEKYVVVPTEANPSQALERAMAGLRNLGDYHEHLNNPEKLGLTGWGGDKISADHRALHLLNCISRGARWAFPSCRSIINIGAQGVVCLSLNDKGRVLEYRINDKCATGSGKFLEVISGALEIQVEDIPEVIKGANKHLTITSQCAVFTESEVVGLVNDGETVANIMAAILDGLAKSVATLSRRIRIQDDVVVSGGLAKNAPFVAQIQAAMARKLKVFSPPDIIAAVGAALAAQK